jgi:hypothetical protein
MKTPQWEEFFREKLIKIFSEKKWFWILAGGLE